MTMTAKELRDALAEMPDDAIVVAVSVNDENEWPTHCPVYGAEENSVCGCVMLAFDDPPESKW